MKLREIQARTALTKSRLPESDYCINPYVGCTHGCVYCYARFMKRFTGHTEPWGEFLDVKINAAEVLRKELKRKRTTRGTVLLGSVTDAYQPMERKYEITRKILSELTNSQLDVSILTKSDLVVRDIDLLKKLKRCTVGFTITSTNEDVRRHFEPRAASIARRIEALRKVSESGIETYVFVGPIFPLFTDLSAIFEAVKNYTDTMWAEALNTSAGNWESIIATVNQYDPTATEAFSLKARDRAFWDTTEKQFIELCDRYEKCFAGFFRHRK